MRQQGSIYQSGAAPILDFLEEHKQERLAHSVLCSVAHSLSSHFPYLQLLLWQPCTHNCLLSGTRTTLYFV